MKRIGDRPMTNAEKQKAYRQRQKAQGIARKSRSKGPKAFVGWDSEGRLVDDQHVTDIFNNSRNEALVNPKGILGSELLAYFHKYHKRGDINVFFSFGYDVTMILKALMRDNGFDDDGARQWFRDLADNDEIDEYTLLIVGRARVHIKYRPRKYLVIRYEGKVMIWQDVFAFFQASFLTTMKEWVPDLARDTIARIEEGKSQRQERTDTTDEYVRYCYDECVTLVEIMNRLRIALEDCNLSLNRWDGPGAVAQAKLQSNRIKSYMIDTPEFARVIVSRAFSGGRIETTVLGYQEGEFWDYDINSAYPSKMKDLPCLSHAEIVLSDEPKGPWSIHHIKFEFKKNLAWYPLWARTSRGEIRYPYRGEGCYYTAEYNLAKAYAEKHGGTITYLPGSLQIRETCNCKPFAFIQDDYDKRREWKATSNPAEKGMKLIINSLYGKTCQQKGSKDYASSFFQLEWAGMITAGTRAQLGQAALLIPLEDTLMFATDGLLTKSKVTLPLSKDLGAWDIANGGEPCTAAQIIMPGIYRLYYGTKEKLKYRGFVIKKEIYDLIRKTNRREIVYPVTRFNTHSLVRVNAISLAEMGNWVATERTVSLNGESAKRKPVDLRKWHKLSSEFVPLVSKDWAEYKRGLSSYAHDVAAWEHDPEIVSRGMWDDDEDVDPGEVYFEEEWADELTIIS